LKARRRVPAVAAMTLGMVLLAGPAIADPITEVYCSNRGKAEVDLDHLYGYRPVESPQVGLVNLANSLNNVLSILNAKDSFRIEDVKLIENVNILTSASAATSCR
jgi:hypothetical protein